VRGGLTRAIGSRDQKQVRHDIEWTTRAWSGSIQDFTG
jgi:hypothetical protein